MTDQADAASGGRGGLMDNPEVLARAIAERVPGLAAAARTVESALADWFVVTNSTYGWDQAEQVPSSMAINDFADLLFDLLAGRGRPAARGCRSLFENLVTVLDVVDDPVAGQRFLAHRAVVEQLASGLTWEVEQLSDRERRSEQHRLHALGRDSKDQAAAATDQYGPAFRRGWAGKTLKDRAAAHGLAADYAVYQLMSAVLHGSSGGALGTVRQRGIQGLVTHRLGPALSLCPLAYLRGVTYFRLLLERLVAHSGRTDLAARAQPLLEGLGVLLDLWPSYRRAIVDLDEQMWASALPVPTQVTVLALDREGSVTWWIWDLTTRHYTRAREPEGTADTTHAVHACQQQIRNFRPIFWKSRTHINVAVWDVVTTPVSPTWSSSEYFVHDEKPDAEYTTKNGFTIVHRDEWAPPPVLTGLIAGGLHLMRWEQQRDQ